MKMFLISSSPLRNVLMSPEMRYLCEATDCMMHDNVGLSRLCQIWILKAQHTQTCFCLSSRLPCQDPSRTSAPCDGTCQKCAFELSCSLRFCRLTAGTQASSPQLPRGLLQKSWQDPFLDPELVSERLPADGTAVGSGSLFSLGSFVFLCFLLFPLVFSL